MNNLRGSKFFFRIYNSKYRLYREWPRVSGRSQERLLRLFKKNENKNEGRKYTGNKVSVTGFFHCARCTPSKEEHIESNIQSVYPGTFRLMKYYSRGSSKPFPLRSPGDREASRLLISRELRIRQRETAIEENSNASGAMCILSLLSGGIQ